MDYYNSEALNEVLKNRVTRIIDDLGDLTDFLEEKTTADDEKYFRIWEKLLNIWSELYFLRLKI